MNSMIPTSMSVAKQGMRLKQWIDGQCDHIADNSNMIDWARILGLAATAILCVAFLGAVMFIGVLAIIGLIEII